jgi:protein SCO1/2
MMPPFALTDQNGERITLETLRGHPFVLTFIFTRCPIPNFCPLMSKNFTELQGAIKNGSGTLAQTRLLSISFDPDFDTPQILKSYAEHEQADRKIWAFATGEKSQIDNLTRAFSVYVQAEAGTISHGLATALIGEDGKIARIWRGNGWRPSEVLGELEGNKQPAK